MKSNTRKSTIYIVAFFAVAAFNIIAFTSNAGEVAETQKGTRSLPQVDCYQTMGYCDGWSLRYKCNANETAEACRRYACEECGNN